MIRKNILYFLNIRQEESRLATQLFLVQFFLVTGASFLLIIAYSVFLADYHIAELPRAYLVSGVFLLAGAPLYARAEHLWELPRLLSRAIVFCLLITLLVWAGLRFTSWPFLPYVLFVWNNIVYMLSGLVFWGLAALLFNVRESRRVFTIIGAGDIPAKLLGYLAVSLLAPVTGLQNMILISVISFLVAFLLARRLFRSGSFSRRHLRGPAHHHEVKEKRLAGGRKKTPGSELISAVSWLSLLTFIVLILVDFIFLKEVKVRYHTDVQIARFFGIFFAAGRILALLLKVTLSSRIMDRLGLIGSLALSPLLLLAAAVFIVGANLFGAGLRDFLYLFGALSLLTEILKSVIQEPIFLVLFQPLKLNLRLKGHLIAKGYMYALAFVLAGIFLAAYLDYIRDPFMVRYSLVLAGVILSWLTVIYLVRRQYVKTLHAALKSGFFRGNELFLNDKHTLGLLVKKALGSAAAGAVFAMDLLERSGYPGVDALLERRLKSAEFETVNYSLERITARKTEAALPAVQRLLDLSGDPRIRARCIGVIAGLSRDPYDKLIPLLDDQSVECRRAAVAGLLKCGDLSAVVPAGQRLLVLMQSKDADQRILAAQIIGDTEIKSFYRELQALIDDEDADVQRAAILAAGKIGNENLLPMLMEKLNNRDTTKATMTALAGYGDPALDYYRVLEANGGGNDGLLSRFISVAANINTPHAMDFLLHYLPGASRRRKRVTDILWEKGFAADAAAAKQVHHLIGLSLEEALLAAGYALKIQGYAGAERLYGALVTEAGLDAGMIFKLLSFNYDRHKINGAMNALLGLREDFKSSNAYEMLEVMLPKNLFRQLSRLLDFIDHPAGEIRIAGKQEGMEGILKDIIRGKANQFNEWTRATAIALIGKLGEPALTGFLEEGKGIPEPPIIRETINYVLSPVKT